MKSLAKALDRDNFSMSAGVAGKAREGIYPVRTASGLVQARRAAGCLLTPESGDRVLLAEDELGTGYILTVLERDEKRTAIIDVPGDVTLKAGGQATVVAGELLLAGKEAVNLAAPMFSLRAKAGNLEVGSLSFLGRQAQIRVEKVKTALGALDSSVGRVVERILRRYSRIEELADERYGRLRCLVRESLSMKGKSVSLKAEERMGIDGKKIDIG